MTYPIEICKGTPDDSPLITDYLRRMVEEMVLHGGDAVNPAPEVWADLEAGIKANCVRAEYKVLLAVRSTSNVPEPVGMAMACLDPLEAIFLAKTRLHISAVYTIPGARQQGVAKRLIVELLAWGRERNAVEADLNVLMGNPARHL